MYLSRTVEATILENAKSFPCIVVYGPRQVGKSTTVNHLFGAQFQTVTLDDLDDRSLAKQNPKQFLEMHPWPVIIDEIQKAPELLDEIKKAIDTQRLEWVKTDAPRQLMYILTGSNQFELQQGISDSLAGRCGIIDLASFSQAEKQGATAFAFHPDIPALIERERANNKWRKTRPAVFAEIFQGGMPDVVTGVSARETYFKSYVSTYIEKDVKAIIAAGSELQFRNFLSIVALRTAQELHYDAIANSVGIDVRTCKKWLSILETSGIVYLLHPYMANASKRVIKAPKLYFMDTGLCAYLCKWPTPEMLEQGAMSGAFFETFVVSELVKNMLAFGKDPKEFLFHYRDTGKKEIDLLFVEQDKVWPIEVKKNTSPKQPTKNFKALDKYGLNIQPGLVIDTCDKIRPVGEIACTLPVYLLGL